VVYFLPFQRNLSGTPCDGFERCIIIRNRLDFKGVGSSDEVLPMHFLMLWLDLP
jgi:hypothetical protein